MVEFAAVTCTVLSCIRIKKKTELFTSKINKLTLKVYNSVDNIGKLPHGKSVNIIQ